MQNDTKKRKKIAPVICAGVVIALLLVYLMIFLYPVLGAEVGDGLAVIILIACALAILAVIGGVILALRQRLKEIEGGEEEDARKY